MDQEKVKKLFRKIESDPLLKVKVEEWRKNWKPKKDLQLTNSSSNKRPDSPTVVAMATIRRMSAFTVTQQKDFLNKSKSF